MANDLYVTIQESIILPNGNREVLTNTKAISGVNQTLRRVDTIATTASGSGIEILRFSENESQQTAGSFVKGDVKYIRITNLDKTNSALINIINEEGGGGEFTVFKLEAGKSLMFGNGDFNSSEAGDYVLPGIWDESYYSGFNQIDVIKAKAITAPIQLEYFVASA